jgi:hypothetical protein
MIFIALMVAAIGFGWFSVDIVRLWRLRRREELVHDEVFGIVIGLILSGIGIVGFFMYSFDF